MRKAMLFVIFILLTSVLAVRGEVREQQVSADPDPAAVINVIGQRWDASAVKYRRGDSGAISYQKELGDFIRMSNDAAAAYDSSYQRAMNIVANIKMGFSEDSLSIKYAKDYSESVLEKIGSPRLRKKFANRIISSEVNDRMLEFVDSRRDDGFDDYNGRRLATYTKERLLYLLEFLADKHTEFLSVLNSAPKS